MKTYLSFSVIARIVGSVLLFWALSRHPYGYFTVLRWIVCAVALYSAYVSNSLKRLPWVWIFGLVAIVFNPLVPMKIDRVTWGYVDVATGVLFIVSLFIVREHSPKHESLNG